PHQAQLLDVPGDSRLGRRIAPLDQGLGELLLGLHGALPDQLEDGPLAALLHARWARFMAATARSISSAVITRGGTRRIVWSSVALTITPSSRHRDWSSLATGSVNTTACIRPRPRTSWTPSSSPSSPASSSPISRECWTSPSSS